MLRRRLEATESRSFLPTEYRIRGFVRTDSFLDNELRRITRCLLPIVFQINYGPARNHVLFFGSPISEQFCSPFDLAVNLEPPTILCKRNAKYSLEQLDLSSTKSLRHESAVAKEIRCPLSH